MLRWGIVSMLTNRTMTIEDVAVRDLESNLLSNVEINCKKKCKTRVERSGLEWCQC